MIRLRGVRVHNLQGIDLDLPRQRLIALCGRSGAGKTSLAIDTLYAEGQRRYIETFSAYARQFLEQLGKPDADVIEGLPLAIRVARTAAPKSHRVTVGSASEAYEYLRILFARAGCVVCNQCHRDVYRESTESIAGRLAGSPPEATILVGFVAFRDPDESGPVWAARLRELGYSRCILESRIVRLDDAAPLIGERLELEVVVDRFRGDRIAADRMRDSLETTFVAGGGVCVVYTAEAPQPAAASGSDDAPRRSLIDGRQWRRDLYSTELRCHPCELTYLEPQPSLLSFNHSSGACPECEGLGRTSEIDMDLVVPDRGKTLRLGAVAPWNTPAYAHELEELLALAPDYGLRTDVPFSELTERELQLVEEGVADRNFGGLRGFFAWLERHQYKLGVRVFLGRWKRSLCCEACAGTRLRSEARSIKIGDVSIADVHQMRADAALDWLDSLSPRLIESASVQEATSQVRRRLEHLVDTGAGYLGLDRTLPTLSGGERQRVALTAAVGSILVNSLYVLDEPSAGLHPHDVRPLIRAVEKIRDRGNTVVAVEHDADFIEAADQVVELGPGGGGEGGQVVFQGAPDELLRDSHSETGGWLAGRRGWAGKQASGREATGWLRLRGAAGNNLRNIEVDFPLGLMCLITGVSGSGKSTLVMETLLPAVQQHLGADAEPSARFDSLSGGGQIEFIERVDPTPVARSGRSNPVTFVKAFDPIRAAFAETVDARTRNYGPGKFSFNVEGGRCERCRGEGILDVDMQFLAEIHMVCPECQGGRYRKEVLAVRYRGQSIADVLRMTVREAISFFRGQKKVQTRLQVLADVGLAYLQLGQPLRTLSSGETQRLKLAGSIAARKRGRTLFIMDEPTSGLHFGDVLQLIDCFDSLLSVGHSLIMIEHNLQLMQTADYLIDLGPGAGEQGGTIVAAGSPQEVAAAANSVTGRYLAACFKRRSEAASGA